MTPVGTFHAIVATTLVLATFAFHGAGLLINTMGCELRDFRANEYLAYCSHPVYQDYEHGSLYYDLEPGSRDAMRGADVLFFGSSRTQAGWHPDSLERNLSAKGIRFYMLGFGYDEKMKFAQALIEKHQLKPRIAVINADPFFLDTLSPVAKPIVERGFEAQLNYVYRRLHYQMVRMICGEGSSLRDTPLCSGTRLTVMRNRINGTWRVPNWYDWNLPLPEYVGLSRSLDNIEGVSRAAAEFIRTLKVPPSCIVLTAVPSDVSTRALVIRLAREHGTASAFPVVEGLRTYEGHHLRLESAERWSDAFFRDTEPIIRRCLSEVSVTG